MMNMRRVLGMFLLMAGVNGAWAVNYTNVLNGQWSLPGSWTPGGGPPGAADTAVFNSTMWWMNVGVGNQQVSNLYSIGFTGNDARWQGATTVTVSSVFLHNSTGNSRFQAVLAGACELRVEDGFLQLENAANYFTGDIRINRGRLLGADGTALGTAAKTIYLGSTLPGNDDATLQLGYDWDTYAQSIIVQAGNSGKAIIRTDGLYPQSSGTITLNKPLYLTCNVYNYGMRHYGFSNQQTLRIDGPISGPFGVTIYGIGLVQLGSTGNSYIGDTVVDGGWLTLPTNMPSVVGDFRVRHGLIMTRTNAAFGALSNRLRLGTLGSFGGLGVWPYPYGGVVDISGRDIVLEGNGGILIGHGAAPGGSCTWQQGLPSIGSVISGSGRLLVGLENTCYLNTNNTYTGGTIVSAGTVGILGVGNTNRNVYGTGDVVIDSLGALNLYGAANIAPTAKALVKGVLSLYADYVPTLDTNSSGYILLGGVNSGPNIEARLGTNAVQLGNGRMTLAGNDKEYYGSSLQAGTDGIYRLRGINSGTMLRINRSGSPVGPLTGTNSLYALTGGVQLYDANTYSGVTRVQSGYLQGYAQTNGSPFGDTNGPVWIGGASTWQLVGVTNGVAVKKGALTYEGIGIVQVDKTAANAPAGYPTELEVDSLVRSNKAVLALQGVRTDLGGNERFKVTTGAPTPNPSNGMVDPYYVDYGGYFLTYGANGFARAAATTNTLNGAGATAIVHLAATEAVPSPMTIYALRTGVAVTGANKLTLGSGGLILAGITNTAPFEFTGEGVVFCTADSALAGSLTAASGFIKSGAGALLLTNADNSATLGGTITVNQGELRIDTNNRLGSATVSLNGGALKTTRSFIVTNNVELGPRGGTLGFTAGGATFSGLISGPGSLYIPNGSISNANNNYSGGTTVDGPVTVTLNSRLGTGPVTVGWAGSLVVGDNAGLPPDQPINMSYVLCYLRFDTAAPVCGTPAGMGNIVFGLSNQAGTLTVGGDHRTCDFYGWILPAKMTDLTRHTIIKVGTGAWTLWGECWYGGGTVVSNGTLVVNNWLNPTGGVVVCSGATLDGIGTVGVVSNFGGTVKGSLVMRRLVMNAASTNEVTLNGTNAVSQYGQLNVSEGVTLAGTLKLTLGFAPAVGQSFTILNNAGTLIGTFANGNGIAATYGGRTYFFRVDYNGGDGNDVVLTRLVTGTIMTIR
jgi:autotransporter-associated beta strand protein